MAVERTLDLALQKGLGHQDVADLLKVAHDLS
jgi:hypothetical protein